MATAGKSANARKMDSAPAVRERVEAVLGKPVSERVWLGDPVQKLVRYVVEAANEADRKAEFKSLMELVRWGEGLHGDRGHPRRVAGARDGDEDQEAGERPDFYDTRRHEPSERDREMQAAVYGFIESQVARRPEVIAFRWLLARYRRWIFDDGSGTREFMALLERPLPRFLSFEQLDRLDRIRVSPFLTARVSFDGYGPDAARFTLHPHHYPYRPDLGNPTGPRRYPSTRRITGIRRVKARRRIKTLKAPLEVSFRPTDCLLYDPYGTYAFGGLSRHPLTPFLRPELGDPDPSRAFTLGGGDHHTVFAPTVTGQAYLIAEGIARAYSLSIDDALYLLGTGTLYRGDGVLEARHSWRLVCAERGPAEPEYLAHGRVTIEVEPWVPAETVAGFYRDLQRDVYRDRNNRLPRKKALEVFSFVNARTGAGGRTESWSELSRLGPATGGGEDSGEGGVGEDGNDFRHFRMAYRRALEKLFPLYYRASRRFLGDSPPVLREAQRRREVYGEIY